MKFGYTNESYKEDGKFVQYKRFNPFNHKIDYQVLNVFDYVPNLLFNSHEKIVWEFIEGQIPLMNEANLQTIAQYLAQLHNTKIKFPNFNLRHRLQYYRKVIHDKNLKIDTLDKYYRKINKILKMMDKNTPIHCDLFGFNFILDKNEKIWIVDWEYATMGDKHFDLAYFVEGNKLNEEQENVFLEAYGDYDYVKFLNQKILVNYYVICWVNSQKEKYFDDFIYRQRVAELEKILHQYKLKWKL